MKAHAQDPHLHRESDTLQGSGDRQTALFGSVSEAGVRFTAMMRKPDIAARGAGLAVEGGGGARGECALESHPGRSRKREDGFPGGVRHVVDKEPDGASATEPRHGGAHPHRRPQDAVLQGGQDAAEPRRMWILPWPAPSPVTANAESCA